MRARLISGLVLALVAVPASQAQDLGAGAATAAGVALSQDQVTCAQVLAMEPGQAVAFMQGYVAGQLDVLQEKRLTAAEAQSASNANVVVDNTGAAPATVTGPDTLPPGPSTEGALPRTEPPAPSPDQPTGGPDSNPMIASCMTGPDKTIAQTFADRYGQADPTDLAREQEVPAVPAN